MPHALVAGLGPNGMLATLKLLSSGWKVTAVDARRAYGREIHLSLRQSYLDAVERVDPAVRAALAAALSPIATIEHIGHDPIVPGGAPRLSDDAGVRQRLEQFPVVHVRLDALERCFYARLEEVAAAAPEVLTLIRGQTVHVLGDEPDDGPVAVRIGDDVATTPDLIVVAEGGKSPAARSLGRTSVALSRHALYISVHVDDVLGPITRRLDSRCLLPDGQRVPVSSWATGHSDPRLGTWLVIEVPEAIHGPRPSTHSDRDFFNAAAMEIMGLEQPPTTSLLPFSGTFRFEQQLNPVPTAGSNLVFLGDAAGMGHHALSTGLELGACDLGPLSVRLSGGSQGDYREAIVRSRIEMLAFGMREYHPRLRQDPTAWIVDALLQRDVEPRAYVDARIARSLAH